MSSTKGKEVLGLVKEFYSKGVFCAKDLSQISGVSISGNTLSSLAKAGYLVRHETSPVTYNFVTDNLDEAYKNMEGIFHKEDLENWPSFNDYSLKNYFQRIGTIIPDQEKEQMNWVPLNEEMDKYEGLVYAFVINGKFYKAGKTDLTMRERIKSYNCGKEQYRRDGTCSITNYKILHSILNIGEEIAVYGFLIPKATLNIFGETVEISCSGAKYAESRILNQTMSDFGCKLPGCIQE